MNNMLKRFFSPKWQHQDPTVREQALAILDGANDVEIITKLVTDDPSSRIRGLALGKLLDTTILHSLLSTAKNPTDWCRFAFRLNQLSPQIDELTREFVKVKNNWEQDETFKVIASSASNEQELTNALLLATGDSDALYKIATTAKSIELRLKAVSDINDLEQLNRLSKKATNKQVLQVVRAKLAEAKSRQKIISGTISGAEGLAGVLEKLSQQSWFDGQFEIKVNHTVESWRKLDLEQVESATDLQKKELISCVNRFQGFLNTCQNLIAENKLELEQAAARQDALDKQNALCIQLDNLLKEMSDPAMNDLQSYQSVKEALEFLNSNWQQTIKESQPEPKVLNSYHRLQEQLKARLLPWENFIRLKPEFETLFGNPPTEEYETLGLWLKNWLHLKGKLGWGKSSAMPVNLCDWKELADKYQSQHEKIVVSQKKKASYLNQKINLLEKHCQQRNLIAANKLANYINQKLSSSISDFRTSLCKKLESIQPQLDELRDWHAFATGPKKSQLCETMEQLVNESIEPLVRAKEVRELQQQWRELLASDPQADDKLWDRFKKASDNAYYPCLEYYAEKDKARAENLKNRLGICESLERIIVVNGWNSEVQGGHEEQDYREKQDQPLNSQPDWKVIDQQVSKANREWKKYQPVPENERQSIQQHYNTVLSVIRKQLEIEKQANLDSRCQLVEKAVKFYELDDINESIQGVLRLQKQWKELGLTFYKADREQWTLFRQAIDKVFARRDSLKKQFKNELQNNQKKIKELTNQIEQLCLLDDESLKKSSQKFEELRQSWSNDTELPRASAPLLLRAFENGCYKYQQHYAGIGHRANQSAFSSLLNGAALLNSLEEELLQGEASKNDESNLERLKNKLSQLKCDENGKTILENRFNNIKLIEEVVENEQGLLQLKNLALSMEILLSIDSPESVKEQRMEIQLEQLQKGIGATRPDIDKQKEVLNMFNTWVTIGFISQVDRNELESRRAKIFAVAGLSGEAGT